MKIAVVDPSRVVLKIVAGALEDAGHLVSCFSDSSAALERLRLDEAIEVLVTSLQHAGMGGLELIREARAIAGRRRALYVLVMSSSADRTTLVEALDGGADDFVGKPSAPEELLARLRVAERTAKLQQELIRLATIDSLTGLLNRRAFFETAELYSRSDADAVAIFDIDRFKQVNDAFGHATGDVVIAAVARAAAVHAPIVGRLGGEEFGLLIPNGRVRDAVAACETLRRDVAALVFDDVDPSLHVTCSFGAGEWRSGERLEEALKRADVALYAAKTSGRNRVVAAAGGLAGDPVVVASPDASGAERRLARALR